MEGSLHAHGAVRHSPPLGMSTHLLPSQQVTRGFERDLVRDSGGIQSYLMMFSVTDHHSFKRMSRDEEPT
jgi:hypothetical protein